MMRYVIAIALTAITLSASAADFTARPLRIIIGFPPASAADIVGRVVAAKMSDGLGQQLVIENRPGASV